MLPNELGAHEVARVVGQQDVQQVPGDEGDGQREGEAAVGAAQFTELRTLLHRDELLGWTGAGLGFSRGAVSRWPRSLLELRMRCGTGIGGECPSAPCPRSRRRARAGSTRRLSPRSVPNSALGQGGNSSGVGQSLLPGVSG